MQLQEGKPRIFSFLHFIHVGDQFSDTWAKSGGANRHSYSVRRSAGVPQE
jgi:hypothetical protein